MTVADVSSRDAVLEAINEFDRLGRDEFLTKYRFGRSWRYAIQLEGKTYDSKAIVGAAHGYQFPEQGPLSHEDFSGGLRTHVPKLRAMGFEVVDLKEGASEESDETDSWAWLIEQAETSFSDVAAFDHRERDYKLLVAAGIREALEAARDDTDWKAILKSAFGRSYAGTQYNLSHFMQHQWLYADHPEAEEEIRAVLAGFLDAARDPADRFSAFAQLAKQHADRRGAAAGAILAVGSVLNFSVEPEALPPIKTTAYRKVEDRVGYPGAPDEPTAAYSHHLEFTAVCRQKLTEADLPIRDNLDVQSVIWEASRSNDEHVDDHAASSALHLLLRWSVAQDPETIEHHRAVAEEQGSVWWGRIGDPDGRAALADARREALDAQLENGTPTYAFLHRTGEIWRTRILEIRFDRPEDELELIPDYYRDSLGEHHLWLKLADFEELDPEFAETNLLLVNFPDDPDGIQTAFKGQQSLIYVREREGPPPERPTVWWVNQGTSYREQRDGEFLWAPLRNRAGNPLGHWESLQEARVGDRVLHYSQGRIRAVGEVREEAREAPRPAGLPEDWDTEGRMLSVAYTELSEPVSLEQIPVDWRISASAPFTTQGSVQQGYFYRLSPEFLANLASKFPELVPGTIVYEQPPGEDYTEPSFDDILDRVRSGGLTISEAMLRRYHLSLKTRGFVILAGVSGSGKTWLAELYAKAVGAEHRLVAVAPNWTTNEDLLGYLSPISGEYQHTAVSEYLRDAAAEWEQASREQRSAKPFHLTLDEMNLARVEYYFAKFLSAMEVRARNGTATVELAPGHDVLLAPNLIFSGTVNVDETTHGFADKVYDRAQLLVLEPDREALLMHMEGKPYRDSVIDIWDAINEVAPFAFRVLDEIAAYVDEADALGTPWQAALDEQLLQKVLPKLKGADQRVGGCLEGLLALTEDTYPLAHEKAREMHHGFSQYGFASYF